MIKAYGAATPEILSILKRVGLDERRLDALAQAGFIHIYLSFRNAEEAPAYQFAGVRRHPIKLRVAGSVHKRGLPS